MARHVVIALMMFVAASACGESSTSPTKTVTLITIGAPTPPPGAAIQTGTTQFGGAFIERGSGKLAIPITVDAGSDEPVARLFVYAKNDAGGTCAQNLPDAPDFGPIKRGAVVTYSVTGFQIFGNLPCEVASFRAVLHRRESRNLNTEITAAELIAEQTLTARYSFR
jgi:hypothetical protein